MLKDAAVADFEKARAEWESALGEIPDEALSYLKPGESAQSWLVAGARARLRAAA